jgi:hypothetical protein
MFCPQVENIPSLTKMGPVPIFAIYLFLAKGMVPQKKQPVPFFD